MCYYVLVLMLLLHAASRVNSYLPSFNVLGFQPRQAPHFPKLDGWIDRWMGSEQRIANTTHVPVLPGDGLVQKHGMRRGYS